MYPIDTLVLQTQVVMHLGTIILSLLGRLIILIPKPNPMHHQPDFIWFFNALFYVTLKPFISFFYFFISVKVIGHERRLGELFFILQIKFDCDLCWIMKSIKPGIEIHSSERERERVRSKKKHNISVFYCWLILQWKFQRDTFIDMPKKKTMLWFLEVFLAMTLFLLFFAVSLCLFPSTLSLSKEKRIQIQFHLWTVQS